MVPLSGLKAATSTASRARVPAAPAPVTSAPAFAPSLTTVPVSTGRTSRVPAAPAVISSPPVEFSSISSAIRLTLSVAVMDVLACTVSSRSAFNCSVISAPTRSSPVVTTGSALVSSISPVSALTAPIWKEPAVSVWLTKIPPLPPEAAAVSSPLIAVLTGVPEVPIAAPPAAARVKAPAVTVVAPLRVMLPASALKLNSSTPTLIASRAIPFSSVTNTPSAVVSVTPMLSTDRFSASSVSTPTPVEFRMVSAAPVTSTVVSLPAVSRIVPVASNSMSPDAALIDATCMLPVSVT